MSKFNLKKIFANQKKQLRIRMGNDAKWTFDEQQHIWDKQGKLKKHLYKNTKVGNHFIKCFRLNDGVFSTNYGPFMLKDTDFLKLMTTLYEINNDYTPFSYNPIRMDCISWSSQDNFMVAEDITPKQLKKFRLDSYKEVLDRVYEWTDFWGYGDKLNKYDTEQLLAGRKWYDDFKQELEYAKYNPRHLLGQLEFDRRAEEDGIIFADE